MLEIIAIAMSMSIIVTTLENYKLRHKPLCPFIITVWSSIQLVCWLANVVQCCFAVICTQKHQSWRGQTGTFFDQPTAHGMHCIEMLFTPCSSLKATEFSNSATFLYNVWLWSYRWSNYFPNFCIFDNFSHTKMPKMYFSVTSIQSTAYSGFLYHLRYICCYYYYK